MRLIDADALKQAIRDKYRGLIDRTEINYIVNEQPTIEEKTKDDLEDAYAHGWTDAESEYYKLKECGCQMCKFVGTEEWDMPCKKCKRNSKDYWRAKEVDEQPTADVPQWTPCSEGLPSIETDVLLTSWNGKNQYVGWMDAFLKWHSEDEEVISGYEPIAWMPLPEPWKGEADEQIH